MHWLNKDNIILALAGLVIFETCMVVGAASQLREKSQEADVLSDLARYYADILKRNDVDFTDYDLIALLTIMEPIEHRIGD
jgi:hypothetical protein